MDRLAIWLTEYVLSRCAIKKEDYAIYKYGFQTGIELLLCVVTSMIIAVCLDQKWECILFMLIFFSQRAYVEGIHMKKFSSCFLLSCVVIVCGLEFSEISLLPNSIMLIAIFISLFMIYRMTVVCPVQEPGDESQKYFSKQRQKVMLLIGIVSILFYICNYCIGLRIVFFTEIIMVLSAILKILSSKNGY